jgi:hypothetical protein
MIRGDNVGDAQLDSVIEAIASEIVRVSIQGLSVEDFISSSFGGSCSAGWARILSGRKGSPDNESCGCLDVPPFSEWILGYG